MMPTGRPLVTPLIYSSLDHKLLMINFVSLFYFYAITRILFSAHIVIISSSVLALKATWLKPVLMKWPVTPLLLP